MRRPWWRLSGEAFALEIVPFGGAPAGVGAPLDGVAAVQAFDVLRDLRAPGGSGARAVAECARYLAERHPRVLAFSRADAVSVVREALARGVLRAWRSNIELPPIVEGDITSQPGDGAAPTDAALRRTWIEIELTDMDGAPMPGERYSITLPDGTVREGALDANGRAYFGDLDPGNAEIRWLDRDGDAVAPATLPTGQRAPSPASPASTQGSAASDTRTWVEIELLDMDGAPVPFERYWIKLPDGTVREGALDAQGLAHFDDLDPGQCVIRWIGRDEEATVMVPDATTPVPSDEVAAQVQALTTAARDGVPFCEECERLRREREAAA